MTTAEVIAAYTEASTGTYANGEFVRNGNWQPVARALRHHSEAAIELVKAGDASAVLLVTPAAIAKAPKGKTVGARPAFHLLVAR